MIQYCRYCTEFHTGNGNWCEAKKTEPSDKQACRANKCKDFIFTEFDAYNPEHIYKPRKKKTSISGQIEMGV